ncbi:MAG: DUF1570 domain-containing protein [Planctomycetota bacterium]
MKMHKIVRTVCCVLLVMCLAGLARAQDDNNKVYEEKLSQLKPGDIDGNFKLGLWCLQNKLTEQANSQFEKVLSLNPDHAGAREKLGYVKADGQWLTPKDRDLINKIIKSYPWKGAIDSAGADSEKLPWEKAREKTTEHFVVKTDLSADALNDVCFLLEYAYFLLDELFKFPEPKEKLTVLVPKSRAEFETVLGDKVDLKIIGSAPLASIHGFFNSRNDPYNKAHQEDYLITYYYKMEKYNRTTSTTVLHEMSHYASSLAKMAFDLPAFPMWVEEGLSTYFEASKVVDKRLTTNCLNEPRLRNLRVYMEKHSLIKLSDLINLPRIEFGNDVCYCQSWSLVYFLNNGKKGKYKNGFRDYISAVKEKKIEAKSTETDIYIQNKDDNIKIFENLTGMPMVELEKEWNEFISGLK